MVFVDNFEIFNFCREFIFNFFHVGKPIIPLECGSRHRGPLDSCILFKAYL